MNGLRAALPGEYLEIRTPLHRAPALPKAIAAVGFILLSAFSQRFTVLSGAAALALIAAAVARMPASQARALATGLVFFALLSLGATMLLGGDDGPWIPRSAAGVTARLLATARAVLRAMVALLSIGTLLLTTAPETLIDAMRRWTTPRGRNGGIWLALLIALRLVPLLGEEYLRLRRARAARGAAVQGGSRRPRIGDLRDLYVAYLGALVRRVDELSLALEARGYESRAGDSRGNPDPCRSSA